MRQYNFSEARRNFASVLETAKQEWIICIYKRNGEAYYLTPAKVKKSPLDVEGIDLHLSSSQIMSIVRESREKTYFWSISCSTTDVETARDSEQLTPRRALHT